MSEGEDGGPMSMHVRNGNLRGVADAACAALAVVGRGIGSALANLSAALHVSSQARMPSLEAATAWLNSVPLAHADLRGKVVLVQFWTYSCIEWLRTFPYVAAWWERYRANGLVVIGVHTPEYSFEHDVDNVRKAAKGLGDLSERESYRRCRYSCFRGIRVAVHAVRQSVRADCDHGRALPDRMCSF
jgi:hypothetical protein